jgi:hypothetical protein
MLTVVQVESAKPKLPDWLSPAFLCLDALCLPPLCLKEKPKEVC